MTLSVPPETIGPWSNSMRSLVTLITAAAFMLHFTLGCCAHHAHAAEGTLCPGHATTSAHEHDCHGHENHDQDGHDQEPPESGDQSTNDSECPEGDCHDGECAFMAAAKTVIAKDTFVSALPLFFAEPARHVSISPLVAAVISSDGLFAPPVRTHLFNQVLLI